MTTRDQPAPTMERELAPFIRELFDKSGGKRYDLTEEQFAEILKGVAEKYLGNHASASEQRALCSSLHVEELVLVRACAAGHERAWEDFMIRYREKLHDAALGITKDDCKARELADSLYADLYGTTLREGRRISKFIYYSGRGSLEGWLRTVMAQRHINEYRSNRRTVSLDEETDGGRQFAIAPEPAGVASDRRLSEAIEEALAALGGEDRCILAYYFLDHLTLARIASMLRVHESTISRRVEKLVRVLRKDILLRMTRKGMSRRQAEEALESDVRDLGIDIRKQLTQDSSSLPFSSKKIMRAEGQE
ncbi:MAG: sigma-70 family RNA polymerase sigma factor [Acidobacteria bacterium]|nr:sigma-70 family RNA polymerase sigma factor [Acidobacteriota bacterium]